eukprot:135223-Pleurochrysis_carterae.AAC.1
MHALMCTQSSNVLQALPSLCSLGSARAWCTCTHDILWHAIATEHYALSGSNTQSTVMPIADAIH